MWKVSIAVCSACLASCFSTLGQEESTVMQRRAAVSQSYQKALATGIARAQSGALAEAEEAFRSAVKLSPKSPEGHYNLGLILLQRSNQEDALRELKEAARLAPGNPDVQYNLGTALLDAHHGPDAVTPLEVALALQPRVETMIQLARARQSAGQFKQAIDATDRLPPSYRDLPQVRRLRADCFAAQNMLEAAVTEIEEARKKEPWRSDHLLFEAKLYQKVGNPGAALSFLDQAERLDSTNADIPYTAGLSHWVLEEHAEAAACLQRAIRNRNDFDKAYFLLGVVWLTDGHFDDGFRMLDHAVEMQSWNASYRTIQGMALLWQNRFEDAEKALRAAVALNPSYATPHYHLGKVLERLGKHQESATELEKALALDSSLTEAYYRLGRVYTELGREDEARAMYRRFREAKLPATLSEREEFQQAVRRDLNRD